MTSSQSSRRREVEYEGERYLVRDNGAVFRRNKHRQKRRPLDADWTFGRKTPTTGYMLIAGVPVHRIVCTAFAGPPPVSTHIVDHIDTNRSNNRPDNLRWLSRLENVLLNPISVRRIILVYGSLDAFLKIRRRSRARRPTQTFPGCGPCPRKRRLCRARGC
ncbi:HNH endonuclease signature motif containing protein [Aliirhizobium terrae]|uniref:HNH endonuclease signature motif containing protein n=1 Tax=Terrirhizobium terrae TaxID=2926709 RepID=UPI003369C45B